MVGKAALGQVADVDIRLLRVFRAVAESGGLAAAERELDIGRSTISRHLQDLETRLGVTLCSRGRAGFALTQEGEQIYAAALRLLANIESFRVEVNEVGQRMAGNLTLAFFDKLATNPDAKIGEAIKLLDARAPDVTLEIFTEPLNTIEQGLLEGRYQVGIVPQHQLAASLDCVHLFNENMFLHCGPEHPLFKQSDAEIAATDLSAFHYAGLGYRSPNMDTSHALNLSRHATVYDQESIATLVMSGLYIGFLPDHYAWSFVEQGKMRRIAADTHRYQVEFAAVSSCTPKPSRITAAFLQCLREAHGVIA
jgi:DNA-binding transcriptional LysR family regulator